jgi:phosphonatase-like hydrolase
LAKLKPINSQEMIEMVVFDMAGTTVTDHHEVEACFAKAAENTGLNVSADRILALQGYSKIEVFKLLWHEGYPHLAEDILKEKALNSYNAFCEILENHYISFGAKPTEYCTELFQYLKANNIKIALTTGFYRKVTNIILEKLGWDFGLDKNAKGTEKSIIDLSIASDEVKHGRPKPDMILKAMEVMNIQNPQNVITIGDTPSDILAGDAAGIGYVFAITNGTHSQKQLEQYYPQYMVSSLLELKEFIENHIQNNQN